MTSSRIVAKIYTGLGHRSLSEFDMNSRCRDEPLWRTHIPLLSTHLKDGKINFNQLELFYTFFSFFFPIKLCKSFQFPICISVHSVNHVCHKYLVAMAIGTFNILKKFLD